MLSGYGHVTPLTETGKLFCILYAIVGIPLTLVLLTAAVKRLLIPSDWLLRHIDTRLEHLYHPLSIRLLHLVVIGQLSIYSFQFFSQTSKLVVISYISNRFYSHHMWDYVFDHSVHRVGPAWAWLVEIGCFLLLLYFADYNWTGRLHSRGPVRPIESFYLQDCNNSILVLGLVLLNSTKTCYYW